MDVRSALDIFAPLHKGLPRRRLQDIETLVVHRISVAKAGYPDTPQGIADFFSKHPEGRAATGGKAGYHFLIAADGVIHQCCYLAQAAQGAAGLNNKGIQVGFIGDFRKAPPTPEQLRAGEQLGAALHSFAHEIVGHTDNPGATAHPGKVCPGDKFDVANFRRRILLKVTAIEVKTAAAYGISL